MREILFRGKRRDNGEWVQGDFCDPCNIVFLENGYDAVLEKDDAPCCNDFEVIPETVGQYIVVVGNIYDNPELVKGELDE